MSDLIVRTQGVAGRITLNRPKALNALTHDMAAGIEAALQDWQDDDAVRLVLIDAAGDRAFCAGGDITAIYQAGRAGDFAGPRQFWRDEYRLNARIKTYPKPIVTLMQGFVMGGGVGIACHAAHRVAGETAQIAMPECTIGLVPDVGGSWILSRAPGGLGRFLGATGHRMDAATAIRAGFADLHVPQDAWPDLVAALCETGDPAAIRAAATEPDPSDLDLAAIDRHFAAGRLSDVADSLAGEDSAFGSGARKALSRISPLSGELALALIDRQIESGDIEAALALEYRCVHRLIETGDLLEGIRAQIIDKDRHPRWQHAAFAEVTENEIAGYLAPLGT